MKLYLANGIAFFREMGYIPGTPLKIELDIPGVDSNKHSVSVKVNDMPSRTCQSSFMIDSRELKKMKTLSIKVIVKDRKTGIKQVFPMDPVSVEPAFAIGGDISKMYPESYMSLFNDVKVFKKEVALHKRAIQELSKRGDLL